MRAFKVGLALVVLRHPVWHWRFMTIEKSQSEAGTLSTRDLVAMGLGVSLLVAARYFLPPEYLTYGLLAVLILLLLGVGYVVCRARLDRLLWYWVRSLVTGDRLIVATPDADGRSQIKCPDCGTMCTMNPITPGQEAFHCPECGKSATWQSKE